jgi:hypothetical protein
MLVQKLKPWVTSFSEAIRHQYQHGDTVWVGGEIKDIFSVPNVEDLVPELEKYGVTAVTPEDKAMFDAVYITLDDGVGINRLAVPRVAYLKYKELFDIKEGMVILAEGRVVQIKMTETVKGKTRPIENHPEGSTRILCWKILPLPEKEPEKKPE